MRAPKRIEIAGRPVGPGCPVYVIAEAGSNHDGKLQQAFDLIDVAADAGADAVKFQTFTAASLYASGAGRSDYLGQDRSIVEVIRELEMPFEWIPRLAERCVRRGIHFLSTPFSEKAADALDPFVPALKIASYEMTHLPLVQHCARKGKPLLISTGAADLEEIDRLLEAVRAAATRDPVLLQCTASYPAPLESINLRAIGFLRERYGVLTGLSDHSREVLPAPLAAVALGACAIEKHFTLSNQLHGPDHAYAVEPAELRELIRQIRAVERALGRPAKAPLAVEAELRQFARRSLYTTQPIAAGEPLSRRNAAVLRRGKLPVGLAPERSLACFGRRLRVPLSCDAAVAEADLEPWRMEQDDVRLRPMEDGDAARIVHWRCRDDVHDQLFAAEKPTLESHLRFAAQATRRNDRLDFVIEWRGHPVGTVTLAEIDLGREIAEYGIMLGEPEARGHGVARRASQLVLRHAFDHLALKRVLLSCFEGNTAALALYQRLGFTPSAESRAPITKGGRTRRVRVLEILRETCERSA